MNEWCEDIEDLIADFERYGVEAIAQYRAESAENYCNLIALIAVGADLL